jgi:TetR/AcrR family transcriptional regulator, mexJK operon transcriptional repressor
LSYSDDTSTEVDAPPSSEKVRRGGRPTQHEAAQLSGRILEAATTLFLNEGYGSTSVEAIAQHAGISKRTLYARYANKEQIFGAVVRSIVEQLRPPRSVPLIEGGTLKEVLVRLAGFVLNAALAPKALGLFRLIIAESGRFPELTSLAADQGAMFEAVNLISALLIRERDAGRITLSNPEFCAQQFLFMVLALPQRRALGLGKKMSSDELQRWAEDTVMLFLHGCRDRS